VDGNHFSSGEGGGIQTAQIRGVYWSDVPRNPGWVMFMHFYRNKASIGDYNLVYATRYAHYVSVMLAVQLCHDLQH